MNKAKEYLNQIRELDAKIQQRQDEVEKLRAFVMSQSAKLDANRVRTDSPDQDPLAAKIAKYVDMEKEVDAMIDELIELKHTIIGQIHQLTGAKYIEVLWARYVDLESFDQIADSMGYSLQHVFTLHGRALQMFGEKFEILER